MNQGDILVVLRPRWHEEKRRDNRKPDSPMEESVIKVHSFTPFTFTNTKSNSVQTTKHNQHHQDNTNEFVSREDPSLQGVIDKRTSNSHIRTYNVRNSPSLNTKRKSPFRMKLFQLKSASDEPSDYISGKEPSTSPYGNNVYSDNEDISVTHEVIPIKLNDFQKYITMQAVSTAVKYPFDFCFDCLVSYTNVYKKQKRYRYQSGSY